MATYLVEGQAARQWLAYHRLGPKGEDVNLAGYVDVSPVAYAYGSRGGWCFGTGRDHTTIWRMAHGKTPVQRYAVAHLEQVVRERTT